MIRRVYLPGPDPVRLRSLIAPALIAAGCAAAVWLFGHGFPLLLALIFGKV